MQLADLLADFSQALSKAVKSSGIRGPKEDSLQELEPLKAELTRASNSLRQSRQELIDAARKVIGREDIQNLKEIIAHMPDPDREVLENARRSALQRASLAQAELAGNHLCLVYAGEFYHRLTCEILDVDTAIKPYDVQGNSAQPPTGNIVRRAC